MGTGAVSPVVATIRSGGNTTAASVPEPTELKAHFRLGERSEHAFKPISLTIRRQRAQSTG
jgi:hypothetical protein